MSDSQYAGSILQTTPVWKNEKNEVAQKPRNYKDNTTLDMTDFYTLMAAQLQYQDVLNPESNTAEMMTQMVQMSMVNAISDMMQMSMTTYAASVIGRNVVVAETTLDGKLNTVEGVVEGVSLYNGDPKIIVNGKEYAMSQVMQLGTVSSTESKTPVEEEEDEPVVTKPVEDPEEVDDPENTDGDHTDVTGGGESGGVTEGDGNTDVTGSEGGNTDVTDTTNKDNPNEVGGQDDTNHPAGGTDDGIKTETVENDNSEQA